MPKVRRLFTVGGKRTLLTTDSDKVGNNSSLNSPLLHAIKQIRSGGAIRGLLTKHRRDPEGWSLQGVVGFRLGENLIAPGECGIQVSVVDSRT